MSIKQISPQEALQVLEGDPEAVYLDVRTVPEYLAGHPVASLNVPVVLPNPATGQMTPNPEFLPTVEANLAKDARIIVGCMSGMRSQFATDLMERAGYQNVSNMQGGFGGARDPMGQVVIKGWRDSGLPVESGDGGAASYEALLKKVKRQ